MAEDMQTIPSLEDEFSNTGRPAEDLFDDEIVPNPSPPKENVVIPTGPRAHGNNGRGRGGGRGRGRGRGAPRGRGGRGGHNGPPSTNEWKGGDGAGSSIVSRFAPATTAPATSAPAPAAAAAAAPVPTPPAESNTPAEEGSKETPPETDKAPETTTEATESAPSPDGGEENPTVTPPAAPAAGIPRKEFPSRNRIVTGGPNRQKLTEEELATRMENVRLKNLARIEKLQRAAEDEQKFNEAEQVRKAEEVKRRADERKKQIEDGKKKKELDAEREQNRQRKLKALSNREWDSSKNEEDYNPSGYTNRSRRGAHGGVSGFISNPDASYSREGEGDGAGGDVDRSFYSPRGRGRGGRGRGGRGDRGGGFGRGGNQPANNNTRGRQSAPADIANEAEFPALPGSKPKADKVPETPVEPETPRGTWAEQAQDAAEKAEKAEKTETAIA
ncbi:hypothetical protein TWF718_007349 [Orbilia javanica]|uniref:Uncharacterized protein n=1 Tax=Orbilia javanica TaxID=47235 RepID=A0AAN8RNI0_9PEZI